jgi:hypothetical protein
MDVIDMEGPRQQVEAAAGWAPPPSRQRASHAAPPWTAWAGESAAVAFITVVAAIAHGAALPYLLFPELGALAYDTLKRPHGAWARAPGMLMLTPFLAGVVGTLAMQHLAFGPVAVFVVLGASILIVRLLRSPIAPALSAGLLPLVLSDRSGDYPLSLLLGLALLAVVSQIWRRWVRPTAPVAVATPQRLSTSIGAKTRRDRSWIPFFIAFIAMASLLAIGTGLHFLLFPPLAVIAYEMFAHAETCPWAQRPLALVAVCTIAAIAGVLLVGLLGSGPLAAACGVVVGIGLLRALDLHAPPALAVVLLPLIISKPDYLFAASVGASTLLLSLLFMTWRRIGKRAALI